MLGVALIVLAANLAETTTDFVWHVPGIMALVVVVVAGAVGVASKPLDKYGPRIFPILGVSGCSWGRCPFRAIGDALGSGRATLAFVRTHEQGR